MATEISLDGGEARGLSLLINARHLLAEANSIDDVKKIRDQAEALRSYAQQQGQCLEIQNAAAEIKIRAERRAGEILKDLPGKGSHGGDRNSSHIVLLEDLGIGKMDSHRWQRIARLPEETFEEHIAETKGSGRELTSTGILKLARQVESQQPVVPEPVADAGGDVVGALDELIKAGRKFHTIYADPPWQYSNQGTRASTDNHYGTMDVERICAEPVAQVAGDDAHLHLWTTNAFLFDARRVMEAWGFTYKSCFIWVKPQMGIGNYWRVSHEFLLFGLRGRRPFRVRDEMSWAAIPRSQHSSKPDAIRLKIERVSTGPFLEMYGRVYSPGSPWTVYGNQVTRRLI